jgi:amino acid adenylation domain-containing protein
MIQRSSTFPPVEIATPFVATELLPERLAASASEIAGGLCIHQIVEQCAEIYSARCAVSDEQETLTYQELNSQANQLAHYFQHLGLLPGQPIAIYMEQSVRAVIGMLAVLKFGSSYVPIDTRYPLPRIMTILEEAGTALVLTRQELGQGLKASPYPLVLLDEDQATIALESPENPQGEMSDHELAYIIFTSGTTGKPKGVEIEHSSLRNLVNWHQQTFQVTPADKATLFASISFDASVWELWPYLCTGASVHVIPTSVQDSLTQLQAWLIDQAITICFLPTPLAEQVVRLNWPASLALRTLLTGGDRLHVYPPASLPFALVNNYGPTENTVVATSGVVLPNAETSTLPSLGKPISNVEVYILDSDLQPVPAGETGELYIAGASLARGYRHQPQMTQERFLPHPFSTDPEARLYKTGDQAAWNADGTLTFLGRGDQQVKIRGFRIELGEIEARLTARGELRESAVVAIPLNPEENQLVAFFVPEEGKTVAITELQDYLKVALPDYMVPARFVQLEAMPLLASGKVDRQQLVTLLPPLTQPEQRILSTNPIEQQLVEIWRDLLPGLAFGLHDDFFKIGGHSLSVLQLILRIRNAFHISLTVRDLFQAPTLTQLASVIAQKQQS